MIDIKNKILKKRYERIKYGVAAWHRYIFKHIIVYTEICIWHLLHL